MSATPRGSSPPTARGDRTRTLSVDEAIVDAYLAFVRGAAMRAYGTLPTSPRDVPMARIVATLPPGDVWACVPGAYVHWLLHRKKGFSRAEAYFRGILDGYGAAFSDSSREGGRRPVQLVVWDRRESLPDELLDKLEARVGTSILRAGPPVVSGWIDELQSHVRAHPGPFDHWLLDAWEPLLRPGVEVPPASP